MAGKGDDMESESGPPGNFPVLPESTIPCVWMSAGLLTYRLCDRGYECERCPLDAGIRGVELAPRASAAEATSVPALHARSMPRMRWDGQAIAGRAGGPGPPSILSVATKRASSD